MEVRCGVRMELSFRDEAEATRVASALEPDNEGFVRTALRGKALVVEAESTSIPALLHTLDDYLSCLAVASGLARSEK